MATYTGAYPQDWLAWATGVLAGIGAPITDTNLLTLWGWTAAEKPAGQPTQWNNPLNTTQPAAGSLSENSVGVRSYPDIQTGIDATVQTLQNGHYPNILQNLRAGLPKASWANACADLGIWGTGCSWLGATSAPSATSANSGGSSSSSSSSSSSPNCSITDVACWWGVVQKDLARGFWIAMALGLGLLGVLLIVVEDVERQLKQPASEAVKGLAENPEVLAA